MDNEAFVLKYCIESARRGEREISVFDLMYEGIEYARLKDALAALAGRGEIEIIDIKTFKFIGDDRLPQSKDNSYSGLFDDLIPPEEDEQVEAVYIRALEYVIQNDNASATFIQRRCGTGYLKSCEILNWMESKGYISPPDGPWKRKVLITEEEFRRKYNPNAFGNLYDDDDEEEDPFKAVECYQEEQRRLTMKRSRPDSDDKSHINFIRVHTNKVENRSAAEFPKHPSWDNEFEFRRAVRDGKKQLIKSDKSMGVKGAVNKAEKMLEEMKAIGGAKLTEVYEMILFELRHTTAYEYNKLKKTYFE